ncbi:hypothetical protein CN689_12475 [Peribacillus butanolivorans]|uniref:DUF3953 domain-containing protein n=1 Tax=Peribacillus butanolivorans TaxID=421767 RepID=A0AAX0S566_9BACI|nr:hypothetical protein CN689_12475 [Peribacillus butanolivorans]
MMYFAQRIIIFSITLALIIFMLLVLKGKNLIKYERSLYFTGLITIICIVISPTLTVIYPALYTLLVLLVCISLIRKEVKKSTKYINILSAINILSIIIVQFILF